MHLQWFQFCVTEKAGANLSVFLEEFILGRAWLEHIPSAKNTMLFSWMCRLSEFVC